METKQDSSFLAFLSSGKSHHIRDIILENLVMKEGGPQAILNLRKVCSSTKEWIDTLNTHTSEKVFFRIPISFKIDPENIQKFHANSPPPGATSIIVRDNGEMKTRLRDLKDSFPTFFAFWEQKMTALVVFKNSIVPFQKYCLGEDAIPQKLRYFQSNCDFVFDGKLTNLEHLEVAIFKRFQHPPNLPFFSTLASKKTLKRLKISSGIAYEDESLNGFKLLIDTRRHEPDFTLKVHLDTLISMHVDAWDSLFESLFPSSCKIELSMDLLKLLSTLDRLDFDEEKKSKFLEATYHLKIWIVGYETSHVRLNNLSLNSFANLKKFEWFDHVAQGSREDTLYNRFCSNFANNLPKSLEFLRISRIVFITPRLPESLTYIHLSMQNDVLSPSDCRDSLSCISDHCPLLNKLKVMTGISGLSKWKMDEQKSYSFSNLKSLRLGINIGSNKKNVINCTSKLLLGVFQINQMPALLKMKLSTYKRDRRLGNYRPVSVAFVIDGEFASSILDSPLAKSLVKLKLFNTRFDPTGKEIMAKFQSVVDENERRRHALFGRQGRRKDFFNY